MISKSSSGILQPKVSFENITSSLNQKDKMIELLQRELKSFKTLRQDYDRMKDRKVQVLDKCDAVQREIVINNLYRIFVKIARIGRPVLIHQ